MFDKILIANRGEIACRIARTARRMGISTVAVYSAADANAMHVKACDEAYLIGPAPASESYLKADKIIQVAKTSGAQAIHPGYGFLSENADFSRLCQNAGLVFIGPSESSITSMGSKSEAKKLMTDAGVPLVPGYHGDDQDLQTLKVQSEQVDYPQLIKATAGGGGKGMRVVEKRENFEAALASCKREAKASFGDNKVLIERYLTAPRHIEFQLFADTHGNVVHVFERDCSIQRRHQKVIEEAPAPGMTNTLREAMGQAAIDSAKAIDYVGAGTVEFLLDIDERFYFMEMNTRLQVEHPISEMISGVDLVEWQLLVAAGEPLPLKQDQLNIKGHAFEARIYAESPENDFLPSTGTLQYLSTPEPSDNVRIDTGVKQGDEVSIYYDPMIAKLIVWDENRAGAVRQMKKALSNFQILGLTTNVEFLSRLFSHPAFVNAAIDTGFIDKHRTELLPDSLVKARPPKELLALSCLYVLQRNRYEANAAQAKTADAASPWGDADGWQLNQTSSTSVELDINDNRTVVVAHYGKQKYQMDIDGHSCKVSGRMLDQNVLAGDIDGRKLKAVFVKESQKLSVLFDGRVWDIHIHDPLLQTVGNDTEAGGLMAPMPGSVVSVDISIGDAVKKGDSLMVVEAMKMEHTIHAPRDGTIKEIFFSVGEQVTDADALLAMDE